MQREAQETCSILSLTEMRVGISRGTISRCIDGGNTCSCLDPLSPERGSMDPNLDELWTGAFELNKRDARSATRTRPLDVLLWGDSIIERMRGRDLGQVFDDVRDYLEVYENSFRPLHLRSSRTSNEVQGLALGIGGDRISHLLYRVLNGEMVGGVRSIRTKKKALPPGRTDNPKVFWLLVGTNDLSDDCSREAILVGILNIVMQLRRLRPRATVVVNGILPRESFIFGETINWVNRQLRCYADLFDTTTRTGRLFDEKFDFFDATGLFLNDDRTDVNFEIMPDGLHPSPKGYKIFQEQIRQHVLTLV
eukprot:CAMPEP_0118677158 /NCGR_PEP_ID=MMETSP0800-20121206/2464_1 /TAXON_ID=210618 ORGANISM="Striatella unipunctata, Strain CCMP2910" /NCGR_SAMPLE_ID=MMETSP0800 /ASSEMBLY_ACC=CAM_ASM_000638 /LENGTH=307 /DNA_ID=CAMNT_0006572785 /DNA_START=78 /DNA_END=1001 /DNA_ORIENTATION=-